MFRKLVIVVMLLAAPFAQAKMVLACAMMGGHVTESCCCEPERHHPAAPEQAADNDICCAVAIEPAKDISLAAASESATRKPVGNLWDNSPDIATAPPLLFAATALFSYSRLSLLSERHVFNGSNLYLLTARLRL